ncbi:uncharacterized protein DFL_005081 [Arthrobotrys flagrans]|uniref:Uncharacterized protein n=1 Tax=Arthrobotrys flagrans TaxID=97331 RepID=A0A437A6Q1_ARTFL|nr:hypothetical protein DFL_005081 [Arthrobotrys flagrans]
MGQRHSPLMGSGTTWGYGKYLKQLAKLNMNNGEISVEDTGDMPALVESQMSWYPIGKKGVLVSIGGEVVDSSRRIRSMPMENIWVYDILSSKWYYQIATQADDVQGLPIDRKFFCAVSPSYTEAADSYEIILHGGHRTVSDDLLKLDDAWALTVPTFQWVQYHFGFTGEPLMEPTTFLVHAQTTVISWSSVPMALAQKTQIIRSPGYEKPQIVRTAVGKRRQPDSWDDPALAEVFAQAYTHGYVAPTSTTVGPGATGTGTSVPTGTGAPTSDISNDNDGSGSKKNTTAIAAGASAGDSGINRLYLDPAYDNGPLPPPPGGFDRRVDTLWSLMVLMICQTEIDTGGPRTG